MGFYTALARNKSLLCSPLCFCQMKWKELWYSGYSFDNRLLDSHNSSLGHLSVSEPVYDPGSRLCGRWRDVYPMITLNRVNCAQHPEVLMFPGLVTMWLFREKDQKPVLTIHIWQPMPWMKMLQISYGFIMVVPTKTAVYVVYTFVFVCGLKWHNARFALGSTRALPTGEMSNSLRCEPLDCILTLFTVLPAL